jgi:hypothetical protein
MRKRRFLPLRKKKIPLDPKKIQERVPEKIPGKAPAKKPDEFNGSYGLPLVYKPFLIEENSDPDPLDAYTEVIEEKDGVHYINKNVLTPDKPELEALDPEFRDLVDSVLSKENE